MHNPHKSPNERNVVDRYLKYLSTLVLIIATIALGVHFLFLNYLTLPKSWWIAVLFGAYILLGISYRWSLPSMGVIAPSEHPDWLRSIVWCLGIVCMLFGLGFMNFSKVS
jgi:hypothetical protein